MAIREYINRNLMVAAASAGVALVVIIGFVVWQMSDDTPGPGDVSISKRYFSTDDGNTFFPETIDKIPPFTTSDNKTAYRAHVVRCGTGAPFVAHLEKYPEDQKKKLEAMFADASTRGLALESVTGPQDMPHVKKPKTGETGWVDPLDVKQYDAIVSQSCKGGGTPQPVYPQ